ncbi:PRP38 family-domain-containing protein [Dimargaris cristalligena]|uniref:Pre-mRNA-splicing factor 38 n=1 Tax=Dimargaris cristalligena TaxID=215637 RepID=A0A4P9ZZS8_9FUNG|nr:PRP38 family-domain-containing protein [Dimargaris cristalligena]|eukprot:RKP38641.1 PRP38 family-domain-containing protein [Dimargaris cristalligena]
MQPPTEQLVDKESKAEANKLETTGNETTMNLNNIVYQNIQSSPYFKSLYEFKTYHEIIDEVYNRDPFLKGTTASSAFCLLYKLWTLRLTVKQINGLLNHPDSPYIRGLGLLYLRYVCKPVKLWDWFEPFLDDREEIFPISAPKVRCAPFPNPTRVQVPTSFNV